MNYRRRAFALRRFTSVEEGGLHTTRLPLVRGAGSRQGFPEANEMSFGGSLRSETEGIDQRRLTFCKKE